MRLILLLPIGSAFLGACGLDPVDPNGEFTITGMAVDALGEPAAGQTIHIYKVDSVFSRESNFLQHTSVRQAVRSTATHRVTTEPNGAFSLTVLGSEVNTEDGAAAAYLAAVYFEQGIEDAFLATASGWHYFRDEDPVWEVGELELWNGGTATQTDELINFSWDPGAPADNTPTTGIPSFYFAWDYASDDNLPRWAGHAFDTSASVPRAAFAPFADHGLKWFVTTFSEDGGRGFQHRSNLHSENTGNSVSGFDSNLTVTELAVELFAGAPSSPFSTDNANDGSVDTFHDFGGTSTVDIYIDIGGAAFSYVFLYGLRVGNSGNATISIFGCEEASVGVECGTPIGAPHSGDWDVDQSYVANSGGGTADWLRVSVERKVDTAAIPYFARVSEIRVVH